MNTTTTIDPKKHLPILQVLHRYENKWSFFGGLTYRNTPPRPETQIVHFRELMNDLADLNRRAVVIDNPSVPNNRRRFGDRLHWFVRVETASRTHLHFVLGGERLLNSRNRPMTTPEVCRFIENRWSHGKAEVEMYDQSQRGVDYINKVRKEIDRDDAYYLSPALFKMLKNQEVAR